MSGSHSSSMHHIVVTWERFIRTARNALEPLMMKVEKLDTNGFVQGKTSPLVFNV